MKKRLFFLPFLIMAVLFLLLRLLLSKIFTTAPTVPHGAKFFLIADIVLISLAISVPVILPEIGKTIEGKKQFRHALFIFSAIYIPIASLLVLGIPTSALRVDVGCLILFMISFLYCLNVYLSMMWLHRLPAKSKIASDLQSQIIRAMDSLAERADSLTSAYDAEKERILRLPSLAREIKGAKAIEAAVMEQNIMSRISAFTAAYENVLAGTMPDTKKFVQTLSELESLVQQRIKMN